MKRVLTIFALLLGLSANAFFISIGGGGVSGLSTIDNAIATNVVFQGQFNGIYSGTFPGASFPGSAGAPLAYVQFPVAFPYFQNGTNNNQIWSSIPGAGIPGDGGFAFLAGDGWTPVNLTAATYYGNGGSLTNLNGAQIQAGTINSNAFDQGTLNFLTLPTGVLTNGGSIGGDGSGLSNLNYYAVSQPTNRTIILPLTRFYDLWAGTLSGIQYIPQYPFFRMRNLSGSMTGVFALLTRDEVSGYTNFTVSFYFTATNAGSFSYVFADYYLATNGTVSANEPSRTVTVTSNAFNVFTYTRSFAPTYTNGMYQIAVYPQSNPTNIWLSGAKITCF